MKELLKPNQTKIEIYQSQVSRTFVLANLHTIETPS